MSLRLRCRPGLGRGIIADSDDDPSYASSARPNFGDGSHFNPIIRVIIRQAGRHPECRGTLSCWPLRPLRLLAAAAAAATAALASDPGPRHRNAAASLLSASDAHPRPGYPHRGRPHRQSPSSVLVHLCPKFESSTRAKSHWPSPGPHPLARLGPRTREQKRILSLGVQVSLRSETHALGIMPGFGLSDQKLIRKNDGCLVILPGWQGGRNHQVQVAGSRHSAATFQI